MPLDPLPAPIPMPVIDLTAAMPAVSSIRELLGLSTSAHQRYRENVRTHISEGDATLARAAINDAYRWRLAAHQTDPQHTDAAWAESPASHDELMAFYEALRAR